MKRSKHCSRQPAQRYSCRYAQVGRIAGKGFLALTTSVLGLALSFKASADPTLPAAQLRPDATLGAERSTVIESSEESSARTRLGGGATRGAALFHSFSDFNVGARQQVYFTNPDSITTILTRVTGTQASNILGTLGVEGAADLFLVNPNGIVFGENARLDLAGSFAATTAAQLWIEGAEFSAVRPAALPLLTVSVTPGIQYGASRPERLIENRGVLVVDEQQQLTLQGGTVRQAGQIVAPAGLVELSGTEVELEGTVDTRSPNGSVGALHIDPKNILIAPNEPISGASVSSALATNDVVLQADNDITVADDITGIFSNNLTFSTGRSLLIAPGQSILLNGGNFTARMNDQPVNAADRDPGIAAFSMGLGAQITTNGGSASVTSGTFGEASRIDTASAAIVTGSNTNSGGDIELSALNTVATGLLDSRSRVGVGGDIGVRSERGAIATNNNLLADGALQAGDISLTAGDSIAVNGTLTANSFGLAGDVILTAGGDLDLQAPAPISRVGDIDSSGSRSGLISITSGGKITTDDFRLVNRISGDGVGGDIRFSGESIEFNRTSISSRTRDESQAFLGFEQAAITGDILVEATEDIVLRNTNLFTSADFGSGDTGDVTVNTRRLQILTSPGFVFPFSSAFGIFAYGDVESTGDGGNIDINASESVEIVGKSPGEFVPSTTPAQAEAVIADLLETGTSIFSTAFGGGNAGDIRLRTGQLNIRDGAGLVTSAVFDEGGDITVVADEITLQGLALITTGTGATGLDAGDINLQAGDVSLTNGGVITTSSFGPGNAGDLSLMAQQLRIRGGSAVSTSAFDSGNGGRLTLQADDFIDLAGATRDGSAVSTIASNSFGAGAAGPLTINTGRLTASDRAAIVTATLGSGAGADIQIETGTLQVNNARIDASTTTAKDGGDIQIQASDSVEIEGNGFDTLLQEVVEPAFGGTLNLDSLSQGIITGTASEGNAGSVRIETSQFTARNGALISTSTFGRGSGGNIEILADSDLQLESTLLATGTFTEAPSGDIRLQTRRLRASGGAQAITTTFGTGTAGDLTVAASESIDLIDPSETGIASGLLASSFQTAAGTGGDIRIDTRDFRILDGATVSVSGAGRGDAGNIDVGARSLLLNRGAITATSASGEGGNIRLRIDDVLSLRNGSTISTTAGQPGRLGNGGNITFSDGFIIAVPTENSDITANAFEGRGGNVSIVSQGLYGIEFRDRLTPASDITASSEVGLDGEVEIELIDPLLSATTPELAEQTEPDDQVAARCGALSNEANSFVVSGRGGLPTDPRQRVRGETVLQDLRSSTSATAPVSSASSEHSHSGIVEAQGWKVDTQGRIQLVADSVGSPRLAVNCSTAEG